MAKEYLIDMRRVASSNEFFDILDKIGNGKFVTIGYVTGANLDVPKVSRKNPLTNRMKQYPDYTVFGSEEEIGALVKISSYNFQYLNRQTVGKKYGEYKQSANDIRANFGLDPIGDKQGYKQGTDWSPNGPELYKGNNAELSDHSYNPQNIFNVKPKGIVYAVNKEGHIIKALSQEQIVPYLKKKREIDGVAALRKMEVEEDRIEDYISQINNLKFKYINFESNSILWIAATINGEKIVYINDNLNRAVDGIDIRPEDFRAIAMERYKIDMADLHEMTMKRLQLLTELDWRTYDSASDKAHKLSIEPSISKYEKERRENQSRNFRNFANSSCDKQYGIDKIKQRKHDYDMDKASGNAKNDFKYTNGELKKLDKQSRDVHDFYSGKQEYKDGKWMNKESKERNMTKDIYRLTESELKAMIKESTMKILSELDWRTYASAAKKNDVWRKEHPIHRANQWNRSYDFQNAATDAFNKKYGLEKQYDEPYGGDKGQIHLNPFNDFQVSGSRDHDFGDGGGPFNLNHNVYHMDKKYGKGFDSGYGRTRMWDHAHETTPEKFYGSNEMGKKFRDAEKDAEDFTSGKSHYVKGKGWTNESKINEESFQNNQGYSHFAVNKATNKIVNGWDYSEYDSDELRHFKDDYFTRDLIDNDLDPKQYKIVTGKYLLRQGIDPNDNNNWVNN